MPVYTITVGPKEVGPELSPKATRFPFTGIVAADLRGAFDKIAPTLALVGLSLEMEGSGRFVTADGFGDTYPVTVAEIPTEGFDPFDLVEDFRRRRESNAREEDRRRKEALGEYLTRRADLLAKAAGLIGVPVELVVAVEGEVDNTVLFHDLAGKAVPVGVRKQTYYIHGLAEIPFYLSDVPGQPSQSGHFVAAKYAGAGRGSFMSPEDLGAYMVANGYVAVGNTDEVEAAKKWKL